MRVLFIGDVFGSCGRRILASELKSLLIDQKIDVCIANGENAAGGRGITPVIAKKLRKYGVHIITGGNHSLVKDEVYVKWSSITYILRPQNLPNEQRGKGFGIFEIGEGIKIGVINLIGQTFINEHNNNPFTIGKTIASEIRQITPIIFVDFHAEASSEKVCLGMYLDGVVSAVCGTHTHVQTADERILPQGTAFITDVGMTGPELSAIGMKYETVIDRYTQQKSVRFEPSENGPMLNAVIIDIDSSNGKALSIQRIYKRITFTQ